MKRNIVFLTSYICFVNSVLVEGNALPKNSAPISQLPVQSVERRNDVNHNNNKHIIVVGSANADTFLSVVRLPVEGENLTTLCEPSTDIPGGKGCTQAIAAAKLLLSTAAAATSSHQSISKDQMNTVTFIGQFGNDNAAKVIRSVLQEAGVNIDHCGQHSTFGSGRG